MLPNRRHYAYLKTSARGNIRYKWETKIRGRCDLGAKQLKGGKKVHKEQKVEGLPWESSR